MVENSASDVLPAPGDGMVVRVVVVATAEGFQAVARRVEEIDGGALRDAMACWADVDGDTVDAHDVGCAQHLLPAAELEGYVVQLVVFAMAHHGQVVRLGAAGQPDGQVGRAVFE